MTTGLVLSGVAGTGVAFSLIPIRDHAPWRRELFGAVDDTVHANFSPLAATLSDVLLSASVVGPIAYFTGTTIEDADGDRLLIYVESMAINFALFQGVKRVVQRPRPYTYATSPEVTRYAAGQGDDAYQSFYSGHSATAFCAATAGAYLASVETGNRGLRAAAWGGGFAVAAATANLRVRAGKHFYSDIVIGGLVGVAIGYAVPALHADSRPYVPSTTDVAAAAAGVLGGALVSQLLPLGQPSDSLAIGRRSRLRLGNLQLGPMRLPHGAGVGIAGTL